MSIVPEWIAKHDWLEGAPTPELYPLLERLMEMDLERGRVIDSLQCLSMNMHHRCKKFRGHAGIHDSEPYVFTGRVGIFGANMVGTTWSDDEEASHA